MDFWPTKKFTLPDVAWADGDTKRKTARMAAHNPAVPILPDVFFMVFFLGAAGGYLFVNPSGQKAPWEPEFPWSQWSCRYLAFSGRERILPVVPDKNAHMGSAGFKIVLVAAIIVHRNFSLGVTDQGAQVQVFARVT